MADQPFDLFYLPFRPALDANGIVVPGASLTFYTTGTSTLQTVYADAALTVPLDNPVTANSAGVWVPIYIDNTKTYRVVLRNELGTVLNEIDPYVPGNVAGSAGPTGPANNTYTSYTALLASDPTRQYAYLVGDTDATPRPDGVFSNPTRTAGAWVRQQATGITNALPAPGASVRPVSAKLADIVDVRDFGAVGDGVTNDGPAIQAAINAAIALGARQVRTPFHQHAVRNTPRTTNNGNIHLGYDGHGLVVNGRIELVSAVGRTDITFYNPDGSSLTTPTQTNAGAPWRGAGIFLRGAATEPGRRIRNSLTLRGIYLQGGTTKLGTGSGNWDVTHKGVWCENDYYTGDLTLIDSGVIGFRGELLYQGGQHHGGLIVRNIELAQSNGNAFNPNSAEYVDIDGAYVHDMNLGWEGWAGSRGRLINVRFERCDTVPRLTGGIQNTDTGQYAFAPKRADPNIAPAFIVDATFIRCGLVTVGSFVQGTVRLFDSTLYIATEAATDKAIDVELRVIATADQMQMPAVTIYSGTGAASAHRNIRLRIETARTSDALGSGRSIDTPVQMLGYFDTDVVLEGGAGPIAKWPQASGSVTGSMPSFRTNRWALMGPETSAENITVSTSPGRADLNPRAGYAYLIPNDSAVTYDIGLTTGGRQPGAQLRLAFGGSFKLTSGVGNIRLPVATRTFTNGWILLEFDGNTWGEREVANYV